MRLRSRSHFSRQRDNFALLFCVSSTFTVFCLGQIVACGIRTSSVAETSRKASMIAGSFTPSILQVVPSGTTERTHLKNRCLSLIAENVHASSMSRVADEVRSRPPRPISANRRRSMVVGEPDLQLTDTHVGSVA